MSLRVAFLAFTFWLLRPGSGVGQEVLPHPDNSVDAATFLKMGMPALDRPWTGHDYEKAFKLLDKIKGLDKYSLPRHQSPYSGAVFNRLVAAENFNFLINSNYDFQSRLQSLEKYAYVPMKLLALYAEPNAPAERFGAEVLAAMELNILLSNNTLLLIYELETLLGENVNREVFDASYREIIKAMDQAVEGLMSIIAEASPRFDQKLLTNFAESFLERLPQYWPQLSTAGQRRVSGMLEKIHHEAVTGTLAEKAKALRESLIVN